MAARVGCTEVGWTVGRPNKDTILLLYVSLCLLTLLGKHGNLLLYPTQANSNSSSLIRAAQFEVN